MAEPVLAAEFELYGNWYSYGTPRSVNIRRGRNTAQDKTSPGSLVMTFGNANRTYDAAHNPPIAPALVPGVKIRVTALWNSTTYYLFTGYLEKFTQHFGNAQTPNDAIAVFEALDGLALLANTGIPSPWEAEMRGHTPKAWFRFSEAAGPTAHNEVNPLVTGTYGGTPSYGQASLFAPVLGGDNDKAVKFTITPTGYLGLPAGFFPLGTSWSINIGVLFAGTAPTVQEKPIYQGVGNTGLRITYFATGKIRVDVLNASSVITSTVESSYALNGVRHSLTIVAEAGQFLKLYDGSSNISTLQSGTVHTLQNLYGVLGASYYHEPTFDELVSFDYALSPAQVSGLRDAAYGGTYEPVADRVNWILDLAGWDGGRAITTAAPDYYDYPKPGAALALLQEIETTIEGRLWVRPDGTLVLLYYTALLAAPYTIAEAFFDDAGAGSHYVRIGSYSVDWELLTNIVRRTLRSGNTVTVRDATSIATYGVRDRADVATVTSGYFYTTTEATLATHRLNLYKDPIHRIDGLEVFASADPDPYIYDAILGLDLSDRIVFHRTPQGVGSPIILEALVEGISIDIKPKSWKWSYRVDTTYA